MHPIRLCSAALLVSSLAAAPASSQQLPAATVAIGSTLKLTLADGGVPVHAVGNGRIVLLGGDSTFLFVSGATRGKADTIPYAALYRIEVRDGSYPRSTAIATGALATAGVEFMTIFLFSKGRALNDAEGRHVTLVLSGLGLVFGGAMGAIVSPERWRRVRPPLRIVEPTDSTARLPSAPTSFPP